MTGSSCVVRDAEAPATSSPTAAFVYLCQACGVVVPPRTPRELRVVQTRTVRFPFRPEARTVKDRRSGKWRPRDDPGGVGTQIVSEIAVCPGCAAEDHPISG